MRHCRDCLQPPQPVDSADSPKKGSKSKKEPNLEPDEKLLCTFEEDGWTLVSGCDISYVRTSTDHALPRMSPPGAAKAVFPLEFIFDEDTLTTLCSYLNDTRDKLKQFDEIRGPGGRPLKKFCTDEVMAFVIAIIGGINSPALLTQTEFMKAYHAPFFNYYRYEEFCSLLCVDTFPVKKFFSVINKKLISLVTSQTIQSLSFDESMNKYRGCSTATVYIPRKPNSVGLVVYVLCAKTHKMSSPVPVALFPRETNEDTYATAFESAMEFIKKNQASRTLPTPVVIYTDRLFGSIENSKKYYPDIRFIMSCSPSRAPMAKLLQKNLLPGEYRAAAFPEGVLVVCNDGGNVFVNLSTAHSAVRVNRESCEEDEDSIVIQEAGNPEVQVEKDGELKYLYSKHELDEMKGTELKSILRAYGLPQNVRVAKARKSILAIQGISKDKKFHKHKMQYFEHIKESGVPDQVCLYRQNFNGVDILDARLAWTCGHWRSSSPGVAWMKWIVQLALCECYALFGEYCNIEQYYDMAIQRWDTKVEPENLKQPGIRTFVKDWVIPDLVLLKEKQEKHLRSLKVKEAKRKGMAKKKQLEIKERKETSKLRREEAREATKKKREARASETIRRVCEKAWTTYLEAKKRRMQKLAEQVSNLEIEKESCPTPGGKEGKDKLIEEAKEQARKSISRFKETAKSHITDAGGDFDEFEAREDEESI